MTQQMPSQTATQLLPPLGEASIQGVLVRESDGQVDFNRVRDAGFTAVYFRATSGPYYVDCRLNANIANAQAAGLDVGYAHYLTANTVETARGEANYFTENITDRPNQLRPVMIFDRFRGLDIRTVNAIAEAFLAQVRENTGVTPMIRTDAQSANLIWYRSLAQQYPLWVVDPDVAAPEVSTGKWDGWTGWEYAEYGDIENTVALPLSLFTPNVYYVAEGDTGTKIICVTVAYGDTLTSIANLFGTTVNDIVRINAIANPNRIYPGQRLYLRVNVGVPVACCDTYIVRRGDTLTSIAYRFGTTVDRLVAINEIPDEDLITIGQALVLGLCDTEEGGRAASQSLPPYN